MLNRIAGRRPAHRPWLVQLLRGRLKALATDAMQVAIQAGDPIGVALAEIVREEAGGELALALAKQCPEQTVALRELAVEATGKALAWVRATGLPDEKERRAQVARLANNLGNRLSDLGRWEDALLASTEATDTYRRLAAARPDAFLPDLAMSLNNLGNMLSNLGRKEEALAAAEEAVRSLAPFFLRHPAAFGARMRNMLRNHARHAEAAGRTPDPALVAPLLRALGVDAPTDQAHTRSNPNANTNHKR